MVSTTAPKRVLVIDDNCDNADLTAQLLGLHGHTTQTAYGGKQGIAVAIDFTPDVVLLDLGMPEIDGFAVARALRARPQLAHVVLIAYTAWNDPGTRERTLAAGFDQHMIKPAGLAELLASVSTLRRAA